MVRVVLHIVSPRAIFLVTLKVNMSVKLIIVVEIVVGNVLHMVTMPVTIQVS